MPFYDYVCEECLHKFEVLQAISEDPVEVCPNCCEKKVKRLITVPAKGQVEYKDNKELYEMKIKPEAQAIAQKVREGDEEAAADILGEKKMFVE